MAEILHKQADKQGVFSASSGNEVVGEMTYHMETSSIMSIEHTEVKSSERGNNLGMDLLDDAVAYARENNLKIRPVCKFVNVMFRKYPDKYDDINIK